MELNDNEKDKSLWNQYKYGDEQSFAFLFRKYYPGLFNYGCRMTPDSSMVEDCIQELFLDLWRSNSKTEITSLKAYIFKAFKFKLIKLIAKSNKTSLLGQEQADHHFELGQDALVISKEMDAEKTKALMDAFQKLSSRQKEIIYLKFYLNLGYEEISDMMQINYQAARNLIYKAIKELKTKVSPAISISILLSHL